MQSLQEPTADVVPAVERQLSTQRDPTTRYDGVRSQICIFLFACFVIFSRRSDALLNPQFFCEDGAVFFVDAYNGWVHSLGVSYSGYFVTFQRVAAGLALLVPFHLAPLMMNCVAVIPHALPVCLLLHSRLRGLGSLRLRANFAFLYLLLVNAREIWLSAVDAQWFLAFAAFLIFIARPPRHLGGRILDVSVLLLSGMTGPFCIALAFIAWFHWRWNPGRWKLVGTAIVSLCAAAQVFSLFFSHTRQVGRPLGASLSGLADILGRHIYLGALFGESILPPDGRPALVAVTAVLGTALIVYVLYHGTLSTRCFLLYCFGIFAGALTSVGSGAPIQVPSWLILHYVPGCRYWFFPTLAFLWCLVWCLECAHPRLVRLIPILLIPCLLVGLHRGYFYQPLQDLHFQSEARRFDAAPPGSYLSILTNPLSGSWRVRLVKR